MNLRHPLRVWRLEKGLTQRQLATLCGVSDMAVSRWERDWVLPDREAFERLITLSVGAVTPNDWFNIPRLTGRNKGT